MSKKVIPRDKSRVAHAAKQQPKAAAKAPARSQQRSRQTNQGAPNRARRAKAAPQKRGISGFFERLFARFRR